MGYLLDALGRSPGPYNSNTSSVARTPSPCTPMRGSRSPRPGTCLGHGRAVLAKPPAHLPPVRLQPLIVCAQRRELLLQLLLRFAAAAAAGLLPPPQGRVGGAPGIAGFIV